jgi:capsular polysaccharide transport system permease protein
MSTDTELQLRALEAMAAADSDHGNLYALIVAAEAFRSAGDSIRATTLARLAAARSLRGERSFRVLRGASGLLQAEGKFAESSALCKVLIQLQPANAEVRLHYALNLLQVRQFREALEQIDSHLALNPESALGWRNHAGAYESLGEFRLSLASSERAVTLDPGNMEYWLHRAGLFNHLGRTSDALNCVRSAEELGGPSATSAWFYSIIYDAAGDLDDAISSARRACEAAPDNLDYRHYLGELEKRRSLIVSAADRIVQRRETDTLETTDRITSLPPRRADAIYDYVPVNPWIRALQTQARIILALLVRDAQTRFGHSKIGYLWAIIEPVSHLALIGLVFSVSEGSGHPPIGDSYILYYFTGVLPYLLFSNTLHGVQQSLEANQSLLQIPLVQHVDVFFARGLLELLTQFCVAIIVLSAFVAIGLPAVPREPAVASLALCLIWMVAFGIGMINAVIMHKFHSWGHIFGNLVRALYFTSGIFVNPLTMPDWIREILVWNPLLQGIDWVRSGYFPGWDPAWLDRAYLAYWALGTVALGLAMERAMRRTLTAAM